MSFCRALLIVWLAVLVPLKGAIGMAAPCAAGDHTARAVACGQLLGTAVAHVAAADGQGTAPLAQAQGETATSPIIDSAQPNVPHDPHDEAPSHAEHEDACSVCTSAGGSAPLTSASHGPWPPAARHATPAYVTECGLPDAVEGRMERPPRIA